MRSSFNKVLPKKEPKEQGDLVQAYVPKELKAQLVAQLDEDGLSQKKFIIAAIHIFLKDRNAAKAKKNAE